MFGMAKIKTVCSEPSYDETKFVLVNKTVRLPESHVKYILAKHPKKTLSELIRQALYEQYIAKSE